MSQTDLTPELAETLEVRRSVPKWMIAAGIAAYLATALGGWWVLLQIAPTHLELSLFGHTVDTDSVHEHINNTAMICVLLPLMLGIESLVVGWERSSLNQLIANETPSLKTDLACFVLGQGYVLDIVGRVLSVGFAIASGFLINQGIAAVTGLHLSVPDWPTPVLVGLFFFVYTFFDYWTHRVDHTKFLWPLHRYHHSAEEFGVVTSIRQHPAAFTGLFVVNLPMAIIGAPTAVMIYVNVLVVAIGFLIHSKIQSEWGWFGRWVIQSPTHHRAHHKLSMETPTGHFAMAPIWDRLFGTWHEVEDPAMPIGVDTPYRHGFFIVGDMLRDYLHFWGGLVGLKNDGPDSELVGQVRRRLRRPAVEA